MRGILPAFRSDGTQKFQTLKTYVDTGAAEAYNPPLNWFGFTNRTPRTARHLLSLHVRQAESYFNIPDGKEGS